MGQKLFFDQEGVKVTKYTLLEEVLVRCEQNKWETSSDLALTRLLELPAIFAKPVMALMSNGHLCKVEAFDSRVDI